MIMIFNSKHYLVNAKILIFLVIYLIMKINLLFLLIKLSIAEEEMLENISPLNVLYMNQIMMLREKLVVGNLNMKILL